MPTPEQIRIYKARPLEDRLALALAEQLDDDTRQIILHEEQWMQVRCYFARRLDLRPQEINVLLNDSDHVIRLCIAKRHDLTAEQIEKCVGDRDPNVRHAIARHPALTEAQRNRLMADEDEIVRFAVQKGPKAFRTRQRPGQAMLVR